RNDVNVQAFFLVETLVDRDIERRVPSQRDEIKGKRNIGQFLFLGLRLPRLACRPTKHQPGRAKERRNHFFHFSLLSSCLCRQFQSLAQFHCTCSSTGVNRCSSTAPVRFAEASEIR